MRDTGVGTPAPALGLVPGLIAPETRPAAARVLAEAMGAQDLIVFVRDPEVRAFIPALGFPQTLPEGRQWRRFLETAGAEGSEAQVPWPGRGPAPCRVVGMPLEPHGFVAFLDGEPGLDWKSAPLDALRLLAFGFASERSAVTAATQAGIARAAAQGAESLAGSFAQAQAGSRAAVQELQQAHRIKDEFLATMSHELRAPLSAILGWAHMLRQDALHEADMDDATRLRGTDAIIRGVQAQTRLISDLLDVSRIVMGKLRVDLRPVDPAGVIEAAVDTVRSAAQAKEIHLEVVREPEVAAVSADPDRLQQVIWNLLSNAIRFAPRGGRVEIRLRRAHSQVELTVADNGPGIDPAFLPYMFDRFRQADSAATRRHAGLGLGLAIVRHLTELHGGTVTAANHEGETGALFTVRLPVLSVATAAAASPAEGSGESLLADERAPRLTDLTILVIDDDDDSREMVAAALRAAGATVRTASSAAQGLGVVDADQPHLILTDLDMPDQDGYGFIRELRARSPERGGLIPVAALTAHAGTSDRLRALKAGFQQHISKPVQPLELITVVGSLVNRL